MKKAIVYGLAAFVLVSILEPVWEECRRVYDVREDSAASTAQSIHQIQKIKEDLLQKHGNTPLNEWSEHDQINLIVLEDALLVLRKKQRNQAEK